tara:strand:- start:3351 stop:4391 length:1041 start_codon:yes stop_codon:yes gene_type:complete
LILKEGKIAFEGQVSGKGKGPGKIDGVFYNPAMKLCRDLHVELFNKINFQGHMLDAMAATGIRGLRIAKECNVTVDFCDKNPEAVDLITKNLKRNKIEANVFRKNASSHLYEKHYDAVDIDPFGSPAPYILSALNGLKNGGILAITATDTGALCGTYQKACSRRYKAVNRKSISSKEFALRILIGFAARQAAILDMGIEVLLGYYEGHHFRAYLKIHKGAGKADQSLAQVRHISSDLQTINHPTSDSYGPMWIEKIADEKYLPDINPNNKKLYKLINILKLECKGPLGLQDLVTLSQEIKINMPKIDSVIEILKSKGFFASRSIFSPLGIRTNASKSVCLDVVSNA